MGNSKGLQEVGGGAFLAEATVGARAPHSIEGQKGLEQSQGVTGVGDLCVADQARLGDPSECYWVYLLP